MSRKRSLKPRPRPGFNVLIATKKGAAIGQLESAILLWFNEANPISILVLASNAEDCFHAIGKKIGKPSLYKTWLESMPRSFQERGQYIQDFAKHGFKEVRAPHVNSPPYVHIPQRWHSKSPRPSRGRTPTERLTTCRLQGGRFSDCRAASAVPGEHPDSGREKNLPLTYLTVHPFRSGWPNIRQDDRFASALFELWWPLPRFFGSPLGRELCSLSS